LNRIFLLALLSISSLIAIFSVSAIITNPIFAQKSMQTYENEKCGVSIQYPKDWVATESNSVFEDKSRTISDFQSEEEDVLGLSFAIENMGLAKNL
jgi:hypothetical protein